MLKSTFKRNIVYLRVITLFSGIAIQAVAYNFKFMNMFVSGALMILFHNLLFFAEDPCKRFVYLIFTVTFSTFLLSRPIIGMFEGKMWWRTTVSSDEYVWFALIIVTVALYSLIVGAYLLEWIYKATKSFLDKHKRKKGDVFFKQNLQVVSMLVFYVTFPLFLIQEIEPLIYVYERGYLSYYSEFQSQLPGILHTIASFMKISMCLFLATLPSKKRAFFVLGLYEISAIPALIIGVRNPIVLNSLFLLVYYLLRDAMSDKKKWLGKLERILIAILTPVGLVFMSVYAYIRAGKSVGIINPFHFIMEFFQSQGVTFDVIEMSYGYVESLRLHSVNYTFGGIIDYIYYGTIGQKIFGTEALPNVNSIENAVRSHNLSHHLSYISLKESYLRGRGWGSSYVLENYVDYGYIGVIVFGILIGSLLLFFVYYFGKNVFISTNILLALTTIFLIPRAEATGWLTFIVTLQYWICILGCYFTAYLIGKFKFIHKILVKINLYSENEEQV